MDRLSGVLLFIFGLYIAVESLRLPIGTVSRPDSGFFPFGLALGVLILSGLLVLQAWRMDRVKERVDFGERKWQVLIAVSAMVAYVLVLKTLGYVLSTLLIMVVLLKAVESLRWRTTLLVSVPAVIVSYVVFSWWLGVPLPGGLASR